MLRTSQWLESIKCRFSGRRGTRKAFCIKSDYSAVCKLASPPPALWKFKQWKINLKFSDFRSLGRRASIEWKLFPRDLSSWSGKLCSACSLLVVAAPLKETWIIPTFPAKALPIWPRADEVRPHQPNSFFLVSRRNEKYQGTIKRNLLSEENPFLFIQWEWEIEMRWEIAWYKYTLVAIFYVAPHSKWGSVWWGDGDIKSVKECRLKCFLYFPSPFGGTDFAVLKCWPKIELDNWQHFRNNFWNSMLQQRVG